MPPFCKTQWPTHPQGIEYGGNISTPLHLQVPLREAVENFFHSPAWKEMKQSMHELYQFCQHNGWNTCWSQLIELIDPTGESHAYRVNRIYHQSPMQTEKSQP